MLNEKIAFELFGLHLLEPMALITNWLMTLFSVYAFYKLKCSVTDEVKFWKKFFFWFALSTFFGGLGHVFFNYFDIPGKFPNWITATFAGYYAGKAIISNELNFQRKKNFELFLIMKGGILLSLSFVTFKFVFVAVDAILTYIIFCGIVANSYVKRGLIDLKYMIYGVLVCLPSIFIFFFKINLHRWLNKDDLSHLLILACIYFFYLGASKRMDNKEFSSTIDNVIA